MGTNLEAQRLTAGHFGGDEYLGCNDHLNLTHPKAVQKVHQAFLEAGVDVIETNTFRSNRFTLGEFGLSSKVAEINFAGAHIARQCVDAFSPGSKKRFVAGSMGPTGKLLSIDSSDQEKIHFDDISSAFNEQALGLIDGGVDLLLLETQQDILEVKAAIFGIHQAFKSKGIRLPIQAQVTLDAKGRMLLGTDISAAIAILAGMEIDLLGFNCSTGPEPMRLPLGILSRESPLPISCLPNAGMPENINGHAVYQLPPEAFAKIMVDYIFEFGLSIVGGCCGTTPKHLRLLVEKLKKRDAPRRTNRITAKLASAFQSLEMRQLPAPLFIGERLNTQGSRAFKKLMLEDDFNSAVGIARNQAESGAHALDVCVALTEDTEEETRMSRLVKLLSTNIDLPLVIDSTDPLVMEAALKAAPGRSLLNSINLESGEEKARNILSLAKQFNAALIALTIDENGMAITAKDKFMVAKRIQSIAVNDFGLENQDLAFDPLTFTLASGSGESANAGVETLKAIQLIKKKLPGSFTCLGVSNVSFGLEPAARAVLNSVFLYHAVKEGLDIAILNPAQIRPYTEIPDNERRLAEDLIFNRHANSLESFIQFFTGRQNAVEDTNRAKLETLPIDKRIFQRILFRERDGLEKDLDEFVKRDGNHQGNALKLLNSILLPAMKEIGNQFGKGELILPFVLQSAEIMRSATDHLEKYLENRSSSKKGKIILATVYGDVHDIGKNLIGTILSNNGFDVIDLGKQVPVDVIVSRALEYKATAVGLSALLVSTSQQMPLVVESLHAHGKKIPVLIGG
ncbi:MAG TPA: homocysteine S-methyltransferase family protein, partial [Pelolinea sp.]|nr:homocysteine S-methyltransferase family protein [Pelolinea sp.]